ncbi:hypothetical protein BH20ACI1_BH20ACI1_01530 [soil metagenome]
MFHENQQIGNYTLIRKLGRGGFGEVWLAERKSKFVTTKVAVKLPHDEQVDHEAIKQEATLWEQASGHPNILPIIDADEYDGQIVIVSEYAPDGSLEQWLKTHGKMPIERAIETTIQILDGLEFLHSRNIIHRDLKPANILLQGSRPRLADFGISRALRTTVASQSQNISGTFAYMSPEALDGKRSIQTDIWSVGVNLYQFLTGTLPFPNKEPSVLLAAIMMREYVPLPSEIPQNLQNVVAKALAKLPENRYGSTKEMRGDLQKVLRGEAIPNFIQTDSGETLTVKRSSPQRKSVPPFVQNSQVEKETVVRTAPNSKKSALNMQERLEKLNVELENVSSRHKEDSKTSKGWLNILFITVSISVIILCGLYIFNYLSDTKMNGNSQVSKSGVFNNSTNPNLSVPSTSGTELKKSSTENRNSTGNPNWLLDEFTVLDKSSNLMWTRGDFRTISGRFTNDWNDVMKWANDMNNQRYSGYNDWQVASITEYRTIYKKPFYSEIFESGNEDCYWARNEVNSSVASYIDFHEGPAVSGDKQGQRNAQTGEPFKFSARLVRKIK